MFREDYRINKIFLPFQPLARKGLRPGGKKGKRDCVFSASSGSREKNQVNPVILSENILALCLNNYELISNWGESHFTEAQSPIPNPQSPINNP